MDAALLETSLALVDTPDDGLSTRFYELLFERHPTVRPLFSEDMGHQAKMLRSVMASAYPAVTECMVAAMAEIGGDAWTPQMNDSWVEALDAVSGLMLLGYPADCDLAS
jgi:hemoglobin-like flavoprotein